MSDPKAELIRQLNDALRRTFQGGRVMMTSGFASLPEEVKAEVMMKITSFSDFTPANDPHGEHDFGSITLKGEVVFWKID